MGYIVLKVLALKLPLKITSSEFMKVKKITHVTHAECHISLSHTWTDTLIEFMKATKKKKITNVTHVTNILHLQVTGINMFALFMNIKKITVVKNVESYF